MCKNNTTLAAIMAIKHEFNIHDQWIVGYSGGKDSTSVLILVLKCISELSNKPKVEIIFSNSGVENPVIAKQAICTLNNLKVEFSAYSNVFFSIVEPDVSKSFWVKIIGRGYPTPTNKFRWCTDILRVNPIMNHTSSYDDCRLVLGVREDESTTRNKKIQQLRISEFYTKQSNTSRIIFNPIIHFSIKDVWNTIIQENSIKSIQKEELLRFYNVADTNDELRFGCWMCTVVRRDKSGEFLSKNGYPELTPLLCFRNWITNIRDMPEYRLPLRRNGLLGPGPFTISARKLILANLLETQAQSGYQLITDSEIREINRQWAIDLEIPSICNHKVLFGDISNDEIVNRKYIKIG